MDWICLSAQANLCRLCLLPQTSASPSHFLALPPQDYIAVKPKFAQFTPHTAGRFQVCRPLIPMS